MKGYDTKLQNQVRDQLHQKANETFLWVALVCKELEDVKRWDVLQMLQKFPSDLTLLYARMIKQIGQLKGQSTKFCMQVLSISTLAYRPLHLLELAALTDLPEEISCELQDLTKIIHMCGSFLTIREDTIYFIHQSAKDYLNTSVDHLIFPSGQTEVHRGILSRSLQNMSEKLHRNMYNLRDPGILMDQVISVDPDPLARIRYACVYWIYHLCEIDSSLHDQVGLCDNGIIDIFLKKHFLHWLETLSLMRNISSGVVMIRKLENLLSVNESRLLDLVRDARRFILYNRWVIENAPLQAYASALVFSPTHSLTREQWKKEEPEWIVTKPIMESKWSPCLQTLEGHSIWVTSIAFSHDSRQLASASDDRTVKIWDAGTGECLQTLDVGTLLYNITFDPTDSYLLTEVGHIMLGQSLSVLEIESESGDADAAIAATSVKVPQESQEPRRYSYGLSSDRSWIAWHGRNVLWLPSEYRPWESSCSAVSGTTVAIGCSSGRVLVIRFSPVFSFIVD